MATRIDRNDNIIRLTDLITNVIDRYPSGGIYFRNEKGDQIAFNHKFNERHIRSYDWNDLRDENDDPWDDKATLIQWLETNMGGQQEIDVFIQDQHTPALVAKFNQIEQETTTTSVTAINDLTIDVTDATGFTAGKYLTLFNVAENRFYVATVLSVLVNTVTVDTVLDFAYPIGSIVTAGETNMNVNGSITPVIFGLRNTTETIGATADITRLIFSCLASSTIDLSMFGNIAGGITNGIVLRKKDGIFRNIFNAKTNSEIKSLMFDFDIQTAQGNQQDGFTGRFTFAGQSKVGVTIRLAPGEDIQLIVQDDLTTLQKFEIIVQGHEVLD